MLFLNRNEEIENLEGLLVGAGMLFIIGRLHPVIIKTEYYLGKKVGSLKMNQERMKHV